MRSGCVIVLTKAFARAGPAGVLVNAIAPGPIDTPMVDDLSGEWKQASRPSCPVRRFGHASEVAPSAVLASDPGATSTSARCSAPQRRRDALSQAAGESLVLA
jgi:NAD(P)-dependent dehydrogenase (short-subunit alcohol dehydrogenase family)